MDVDKEVSLFLSEHVENTMVSGNVLHTVAQKKWNFYSTLPPTVHVTSLPLTQFCAFLKTVLFYELMKH